MTPSQSRQIAGQSLPDSLRNCLSLDIEVSRQSGQIVAAAACNPQTGRTWRARGPLTKQQLLELDRMAAEADHLVGHNILAFDLPRLRALHAGLGLLNMPALDTLHLNPLAFPAHPYHRLVKHYRDGDLIRTTHNDPLLDSQLTLQVLEAQLTQLRRNTSPELLSVWHWLTAHESGSAFDAFFTEVRQRPVPKSDQGKEALWRFLAGNACLTAARELTATAEESAWPAAYVTAWMSTAGTNSAIPPWVLQHHPDTAALARRLREESCTDPACTWCPEMNDVVKELTRWFGFDSYRPTPADQEGRSLQERITEAALRGRSALGVLPTGTGKSLCYQVPALSAYDKTSALTVVISPLVALMADQLAGLERNGITSAVSINSLLSMPERRDALDRVMRGQASLVIISPEQLRSPAVKQALQQRLIARWVLDEAHCLSKWGHDFRPDYRYIARFIRENLGGQRPPVLCLTATAKPDVRDEIQEYFRSELDMEVELLDGGASRENLDFDVLPTKPQLKMTQVTELLEHHLSGNSGGAIIYRASRRRAEETAEHLNVNGVAAGHFHSRMSPERKLETQRQFLDGSIRVICATNAFGMGIDKPDVRLVIHADIPGSLENYLQEAGRAGRDAGSAHCVLLYDSDDTEWQHGLQASNRLSKQDIEAMLKALKRLDSQNNRHAQEGERRPVIATTGEILAHDEDEEFESELANRDTKGRTAIAWLEEATLVARGDNHVTVFPSCLRIRGISEAREIVAQLSQRDRRYADQLIQIVRRVMNAAADTGISTDELTSVTGLETNQLRKALDDLANLGILDDDSRLTAYVHIATGRGSSSADRYERAAAMEEALVDHMRQQAPDQTGGGEEPLYIREVNQWLLGQGHDSALPVRVTRLLRSLAQTGTELQPGNPNLRLRLVAQERMHVTLNTTWTQLAESAARRRRAARTVLGTLRDSLGTDARGADLLASTTTGELTEAMRLDGQVTAAVDVSRLLQQALLWLHDQEVIRLNQGMTIMRPAMSIEIRDRRRQFTNADYEPLDLHYTEQTVQVHIMAQYAQTGLESAADALALALDYFTMPREQFTARWMAGRSQDLRRRTTPESYQRIVTSLNNRAQQEIVTQERDGRNTLLLAGPGSGKTRVLVHRIAYLVRVRRENPRSILALAYNRHAAVQIRQRLRELIGDESSGVAVLTCHSLAMRLVGRTFESNQARTDEEASEIFDQILQEATRRLAGLGPGEAEERDELRDRLLGGFRWVLVDEYQDIKQAEYELISALTGQDRGEEDQLNIFAVGDDDQNIYAFSGSSTEYIRRFQEDYKAHESYMTENYRSTRNIIDAANAVIGKAADRLKRDHPITVDTVRTLERAGGAWEAMDPVAMGRVQILPAGDDRITQAVAAVEELKRLAECDPQWDWSRCAVIARQWDLLEPVRAVCDSQGIRSQSAREDFTATWQLRETQDLLEWTARQESGIHPREALDWLRGQTPNTWNTLLQEAMELANSELPEGRMPRREFTEWLAEWARDNRRQQHGLLLTSAHRAKGLEFDHVVILDHEWQPSTRRASDIDELRRLYYVAMTRARLTLTLCRSGNTNPILSALQGCEAVVEREAPRWRPEPPPEARSRTVRLSLSDMFLSYAGRSRDRRTHEALAALQPGDPLRLNTKGERWEIITSQGTPVGRLSAKGQKQVPTDLGGSQADARVLAITKWSSDKSDAEYRRGLAKGDWEVVIPEIRITPA